MNNCTFGQSKITNILSISRNGQSLTQYFSLRFRPRIKDKDGLLEKIRVIATDESNSIHLLAGLVLKDVPNANKMRWADRTTYRVLVFNSTGDPLRQFPVRKGKGEPHWDIHCSMEVTNTKVLISRDKVIQVYKRDGIYVYGMEPGL